MGYRLLKRLVVKSLWFIVKGKTVNSQRSIVNSQWSMVNSQWSMVNGQQSIVNVLVYQIITFLVNRSLRVVTATA
jgi:hypothetical protein